MRLKIAADGERFVTEHLVDGEARYAVGRATVVDSDQSSQRGGTFLLRASGSSDGGGSAGCSLFSAARSSPVVNLCTWRNGRILLTCRLSLRIRNTDRYHPVASSPPSAHHDLSWSWGGGFHGTRLVARPGGAVRGGRHARHASHIRGVSTTHVDCAILPHFRQPSAAVDYRVRVRIMIRRHND